MLEKSNKKYIDIKEVCKLLKCHRNTADKLVCKCKDVKLEKNTKGTSSHKLYNIDEVNKIISSQQQQQIVKIGKKGTQLAQKNDDAVIGEAFRQKIQGAGADKIVESAMVLMQIALEEIKKENNVMKIQLDITKEWYTVRRMLIINQKDETFLGDDNKNHLTYNSRLLTRISKEQGYEIKSVPDEKYDTINSYHINVWKQCYPNEKY